jgi:hypothetical protein
VLSSGELAVKEREIVEVELRERLRRHPPEVDRRPMPEPVPEPDDARLTGWALASRREAERERRRRDQERADAETMERQQAAHMARLRQRVRRALENER